MSTLPDLPGLTIEVRGLVVAHELLPGRHGEGIRKMVQSLAEQAAGMGANAIVDVRTVVAGDYGHCVMTGTAVLAR